MKQSTNLRVRMMAWVGLVVMLLALTPQATQAQSTDTAGATASLLTYMPVVASSTCSGTRSASSVFGVQWYGDTTRKDPAFAYIQGTNTHWLRVMVLWGDQVPLVQADPPVYNWAIADRHFAAAEEACVNIIGNIEWRHSWNTGFANLPFGTARHAEFARFMRAAVERYDGDGIDDNPDGIVIRYWELYNEPDYDARWGEHPEEYAAMLKVAYPAIKAASPQAKVLFGGIAYDGFTNRGGRFVKSFFEDVLKAGGGPYFDIMNFHYYPGFRRDWTTNNSTGLPEKYAAIRALLAKYNLDKEIVVTETSWHSNTTDTEASSPEEQSRYVVQLFTQAMANDIGVMIWWLLQDSVNSDGTLAERHSGLVTAIDPVTPKDAYYVFRAGVTWLSEAEFEATASQVTDSNNLEAYRFRNKAAGKTFYVAWLNPVMTAATQPFRVATGKAAVYDKTGARIGTYADADDGARDGQVTVPVGGSPVYILIDQP